MQSSCIIITHLVTFIFLKIKKKLLFFHFAIIFAPPFAMIYFYFFPFFLLLFLFLCCRFNDLQIIFQVPKHNTHKHNTNKVLNHKNVIETITLSRRKISGLLFYLWSFINLNVRHFSFFQSIQCIIESSLCVYLEGFTIPVQIAKKECKNYISKGPFLDYIFHEKNIVGLQSAESKLRRTRVFAFEILNVCLFKSTYKNICLIN